MKKIFVFLLIILLLLTGCMSRPAPAQIAATTLPVYEFTAWLCEGTPITVTRLVTEEVSCLHDYSLNVKQVKAAEAAEIIVISGAGLEAFLDDILLDRPAVDASAGVELVVPEEHSHSHDQEEEHGHEGHHHEQENQWLRMENAILKKLNALIQEEEESEQGIKPESSEN